MPQNRGPVDFDFDKDDDGHLTYSITFRVLGTTAEFNIGPAAILATPGLPAYGDSWSYYGETNPWAFRTPMVKIAPELKTEKNRTWLVQFKFSTRPTKRCGDTQVENPLLEPAEISVTTTQQSSEGTDDRFGAPILSSSHEQLRGPQNEWKDGKWTVEVSDNVALLDLALHDSMKFHVNSGPMWGVGPRCVLLSEFKAQRKFYGRCQKYWHRSFKFEVDGNTHDRDMLDEGTKLLRGHWEGATWVLDNINGSPPDPRNPNHFIHAKDAHGENMRVVLNGSGLPAKSEVTGIPVTVVAETPIVDDTNPAIAAQPSGATKLTVVVVDDDNSISHGAVFITGTDAQDSPVSERIDISDAGSLTYVTDRRFKTVTQVQVGGTQQGQDWTVVGAGGADTVKVTTDSSTFEPGNIHVEKYHEANFFLLGIPAVLE